MEFFGQAIIKFDVPETITKEDYKNVFLNFTNGGCSWISDDIIVN